MAGVNPDTEEFATYATTHDDPRFTDWLRERSEPAWTETTEHHFVRELGADTIDDAVFRRYLVQDYAFVGTLVSLVGYAVGQAPTMAAKRRLTTFLGTITDEEDDYFERSFDALDVPEHDRLDPKLTPTTAAFDDLLVRGAHEGDYEETLAVLLPAEWSYRTWAENVESDQSRFYLREWVELHDNPAFESFVDWLRGELDERGPELAPRRRRRVERLFGRTMALEAAFFDASYEGEPT